MSVPLTRYWVRDGYWVDDDYFEPANPAHRVLFYKGADVAALLAQVIAERDTAEEALTRKGYRKDCDIPACNCGPQWNHYGHAEERLREISDAIPYENGKTILQRIEHLQARIVKLEQALGHHLETAIEEEP